MKTMRKGNEIIRITEKKIQKYLDEGFNFCPKKEWKEKVRDKEKKKSNK